MAMLHSPPLLLLDEPTAGVDIETRAQFLGEVRRLAEIMGTAILYATHYVPEAEQLRATIAVLDKGCDLGSRHHIRVGRGARLLCDRPHIQL